MKDFIKKISMLGLIVALGGMVVLVSGVVPIKASSGHWPVTKWMLDFASDRSVATHSAGIEVPDLDDEGLIALGANTYHVNCQWCHGRPGYQRPRVAAKMTPSPPYLPDVLHKWEANEKFYVVKHGIKFAGMPSWPSNVRDDEIWPVVAFLETFADMNADRYQQFVSPHVDEQVPHLIATACAGCHGSKGEGRGSELVPILAGQNEPYMRDSLHAYANGERHSGIMEPIAARLSDEEIDLAAKWFANQEPTAWPLDELDQEAIQAGKQLISQQDETLKVAACSDCHGEWNDPYYPRLVGQPVEYLAQQMRLFQKRRRGGAGSANLMHPIADAINEEQSRKIANYFSSLQGSSP